MQKWPSFLSKTNELQLLILSLKIFQQHEFNILAAAPTFILLNYTCFGQLQRPLGFAAISLKIIIKAHDTHGIARRIMGSIMYFAKRRETASDVTDVPYLTLLRPARPAKMSYPMKP